MFYKAKIKDFVRVPPNFFNLERDQAIIKCLKNAYEGLISKDLGFAIDVLGVNDVKEGIIIPGDGAAYYETSFGLLTYKPELQEVTFGTVKDIAEFGVFLNVGPTEGMIHVSQTMDDFVSFSKEKVLSGKQSGKNLKIGDKCKARIIAISFKDLSNPKIGLTMRQEGLGKLEWLQQKNESKK